MKIQYTKVPSQRTGLHFHDISRSVRDAVVCFVNHNGQWLDAPYRNETSAAGPFIQCDALRNNPNDTEGYLFIELWSDSDKHRPFCELLLKHLREITGDTQLTFEGFERGVAVNGEAARIAAASGFTYREAETRFHQGAMSEMEWRWFRFWWTWSAIRYSSLTQDRAWEKLGRMRFYRRIDRVRQWQRRLAEEAQNLLRPKDTHLSTTRLG